MKHEETKRDVLRATYKDSIKQQLAHNSEKKQRHAQNELLVPHIQGTEGYPPVPEPSKEEHLEMVALVHGGEGVQGGHQENGNARRS